MLRWLATVTLLVILAGCSEAPIEPERIAFLAADNQTGDPSFDWTTVVINRGLAAAVGTSVKAADSIADARASGTANRFVYNTLSRGPETGELRLHSTVFDPSGHHLVREFTVTGNALQVINRMAGNFSSEPYPLGITTEDQLRKWPVPTGDARAFETRCLELADGEPGFGAALSGCVTGLNAAGSKETVRAILGKVPDDKSAHFSPEVQYEFAQTYMALKDYGKAVPLFRQVTSTHPEIKNVLGYAMALGGDCEGGKKSIAEYSRLEGQEPNAFDSLGEVSFFCGQFKDAEQYFTESGPKYPVGEGQVQPIKAAAARLMTGDVPGAEQLASAQLQKLKKSAPQVAAQLEPVWKSIVAAGTAEERRKRIEATLIHRP